MPKAAAIYTRISKDDGTALGVKRQEKECMAWAESHGWPVVDVLTDNDRSAFSGKVRPAYRRLLDGIETGAYDALLIWHPDRLHRSPAELEHFIDVVERHQITVGTVTAGDYDLATPDGRLAARIVGAVARKESEDKARRLRSKHRELAEGGKVSGGGRRPFGYEADKVTIREDEAREISEAVDRVVAGESLRSIVLDWRARGVQTVTGAAWSPTTIKRLLSSGRIAGLRTHHGKIVGPAEWPAIVDPDHAARVRSILAAGRGAGPGAGRVHLLTGFVYCGRCQITMTSAPVVRKGHRYNRYACPLDRGGCGRCGVSGDRLDEQVVADVLDVLGRSAGLGARVADLESVDQNDPAVVVAEIEARMAELAEMFAAGEIGRAEWTTARDALDRRLSTARESVAVEVQTSRAGALVATEIDLVDAWSRWSLDQRRAVIDSVVERVVIAPTTKANNRFDPARVTVEWRV